MAETAGLRGLDHYGERYVHLDDLTLLVQRFKDKWNGYDADDALGALLGSLSDWSLTMPKETSTDG